MGRDLGAAVALMLVLEGVLPFLNPAGLRRLGQLLQELTDRQIRVAGLVSMLLGVVLLYILR
jgi:hypothetical protein